MVSDVYSEITLTRDRALNHAELMHQAGCFGYITGCSDHNHPSTTPFTFLGGYDLVFEWELEAVAWLVREATKRGAKIVTRSHYPIHIPGIHDTRAPFVFLNGTGNSGINDFFAANFNMQFDRQRDTFIYTDGTVAERGHPRDTELFEFLDTVREGDRVIYVSEYVLEQGVPVRYSGATGCGGIEESCVYLPYPRGGTSLQSPILGATMASLLAVFPDYDVFDLAALVNTCADRYPSLEGGGVVNVPCMIDTICEETNSNSSACAP